MTDPVTLLLGDCIERMKELPDASVDAVVTDPPAGISFMNRDWDHHKGGRDQWVAWMTEVMRECYRVLKPGHWLVVWSLPRTSHWTAWAVEDAGFRVTDLLLHVFASGFPKGRGQLKPAYEPWILAKRPGPMVELQIDAARIPSAPHASDRDGEASAGRRYTDNGGTNLAPLPGPRGGSVAGRWPANLLLQDAELFDEPNPGVVGSGATSGTESEARIATRPRNKGWVNNSPGDGVEAIDNYGDTGGYSRFFLIPKAARSDREPLLRGQLEPSGTGLHDDDNYRKPGERKANHTAPMPRVNSHPTVKSLDLMRHLVRLVTPPRVPCIACLDCGAMLEYAHGKAGSITTSLPAMRGSDSHGSRQSGAVLREGLLDDLDGAPSGELPGLASGPKGLHPDSGEGSSDGQQGRLRDAASLSDGGTARPDAAVLGSGRPHQRDQGRQPARESAGDVEEGPRQPSQAAEEADHLSTLRRDHPDLGPCPVCGGRLTPSERQGRVLDPFLGSGTTAIAALLEGFACIGIEREPEYMAISEARLNGRQVGLGLDVAAPTRKAPKTHPDLSKHQPKVQRRPTQTVYGKFAGFEEEDVPA